MKATECLIAWTPGDYQGSGYTPGTIEVGPWPDKTGWSKAYLASGGACYEHWKEADGWALRALILAAFHSIVVRDRIHADEVHSQFLAIDEYREVIAPDIEGADP